MKKRMSIRRAQSAVICNKTTDDCAGSFVQNETCIDTSVWQAQSAIMSNRSVCLAGAIGCDSIKSCLLFTLKCLNSDKKKLFLILKQQAS